MKIVGLLAVLFLTGCPPMPPAPVPTGSASCDEVCKHVADMQCSFAVKCSGICPTIEQHVRDCVAGAATCSAADRCDE